MKTYKIYPLHLGDIYRPNSNMEYQRNPEVYRNFPILAFYITDGDKHILVDTGGVKPGSPKHEPYSRMPKQELEAVLMQHGVSHKNISVIILTHLHWDHASNNMMFPDAKFYVQKRELLYAANPPDYYRFGYYPELIFHTKYNELDGDSEILDGISVVSTPGHTGGHQSVLVNTKTGMYGITGDLVNTYKSWELEPKLTGGYMTNPNEYNDSLYKLEKLVDNIIPSHDPEVLSHKCFG